MFDISSTTATFYNAKIITGYRTSSVGDREGILSKKSHIRNIEGFPGGFITKDRQVR